MYRFYYLYLSSILCCNSPNKHIAIPATRRWVGLSWSKVNEGTSSPKSWDGRRLGSISCEALHHATLYYWSHLAPAESVCPPVVCTVKIFALVNVLLRINSTKRGSYNCQVIYPNVYPNIYIILIVHPLSLVNHSWTKVIIGHIVLSWTQYSLIIGSHSNQPPSAIVQNTST